MRRLQAVRTQKQSRAVAAAREAVAAAQQVLAQAQSHQHEALSQEREARVVLRGGQHQGAASPLQILTLIERLEQAQHCHQLAQHQSNEAQTGLQAAQANLLACQKSWRLQQQREDRWAAQCTRLLNDMTAQRDDAEEEALEEDLSARLGAQAQA
ncbi:hypothetical protein [Ideonella sp.]|jgi:uncharacterized membrane protein YdfJ with MMPL/SSD domain|uniref:hypothetical protein n=1 Tax=Ideonella sp. TaxID=1929293 RepID=UPI0037C0FF1B